MDDAGKPELKIDDLERMTGQPKRNIRFLISEEIVPGPRGTGRGAHYGPEHVRALSLYAELKETGIHSLDFIRKKVKQEMEGVSALEIVPVEGVAVRIENSVLGEMGIDALVAAIGDAVRKAAASKNGEDD